MGAICIDQGRDWSIFCSDEALALNSLSISPNTSQSNTSELYRLMKKVAQFWEESGVLNYLVYKSSADRGWEMVPVPVNGPSNSLWDRVRAYVHQLVVLMRVTFGRYQVAYMEKHHLITKYTDLTSFVAQHAGQRTEQVAEDAFCKKEVIDSQRIFEGKCINVLYNYAPIGDLHFLLVPKKHKERLSDLSEQEFTEIQTLTANLIKKYPGYLCYQYSKTGKLAGQTVAHFHQHVVFILPKNDLWGKLSVFFRMILPPKPLSASELADRVLRLSKKD